mmetsp:Transcript_35336/g.112432  ORF Transcript_35336/g.112432 Transcript_35336/m.112432 type:complete len:293 (+) Transcript_35336:529-1407(+)
MYRRHWHPQRGHARRVPASRLHRSLRIAARSVPQIPACMAQSAARWPPSCRWKKRCEQRWNVSRLLVRQSLCGTLTNGWRPTRISPRMSIGSLRCTLRMHAGTALGTLSLMRACTWRTARTGASGTTMLQTLQKAGPSADAATFPLAPPAAPAPGAVVAALPQRDTGPSPRRRPLPRAAQSLAPHLLAGMPCRMPCSWRPRRRLLWCRSGSLWQFARCPSTGIRSTASTPSCPLTGAPTCRSSPRRWRRIRSCAAWRPMSRASHRGQPHWVMCSWTSCRLQTGCLTRGRRSF